jgi:dihydrofolate reductase
MGRIVVSEFVSLDGVSEAPGGEPGYRHTNWVGERFDDSWLQFKVEEVLAHDVLLIGRRTYESFAEAWPSRQGPIADKFNAMPKYVASTTLKTADWHNTTILGGNALDAVAARKREIAGDFLVHGSRTLVNGLKSRGLVDEYRLLIFPVVLGSGRRLFDEVDDALSLQLVESRPFANGTLLVTYRPV